MAIGRRWVSQLASYRKQLKLCLNTCKTEPWENSFICALNTDVAADQVFLAESQQVVQKRGYSSQNGSGAHSEGQGQLY